MAGVRHWSVALLCLLVLPACSVARRVPGADRVPGARALHLAPDPTPPLDPVDETPMAKLPKQLYHCRTLTTQSMPAMHEGLKTEKVTRSKRWGWAWRADLADETDGHLTARVLCTRKIYVRAPFGTASPLVP